MRRPPRAARHFTAHPLPFAAAALTILITTMLAAAAAGFGSAVTGASVRSALGGSPGRTILVTDQVPTAGVAADGRRIMSILRRALPGLPLTFTASLRSGDLDLPPAGPTGRSAQTQVISLPGLTSHAVLTAGSWPGPGSGPLPVAVPAPAARLLHLAPGDILTTRDSVTHSLVRTRITGVFRERDAASAYWSLSPVGPSGVSRAAGFSVYGPLATTPAVAASQHLAATSAAWLGTPDVSRLTAPSLAALSTKLSVALGLDDSGTGLAQMSQVSAATGLPGLLNNLGTALVVTRSQLLIGLFILMAVAGVAVVVSVRLLTTQRAAEMSLLAARGAGRRQLGARGVAEGIALALPAAVPGPLAGSWLASVPARFGPLAADHLRLGTTLPASGWLAAALAAAGCAVIVALPWLRAPTSPVQQRVLSGRQRAAATMVSAGGDLGLIALAALAVWQLTKYQASSAGILGVDPVLAIAPVLALAAGTVVMLRVLPLLTRLTDRAAARSRGITVAMGSWQISRRPLRQAGPALLAVLATATAVLALAQHASWQRSVAAQAAFTVGADERIVLPQAVPLPLGSVAGVTAAPGIRASTPAVRTPAQVGSQQTTVLALDAVKAQAVLPLNAGGGLGAARLNRLAQAGPPAGVALPGRPVRLSVAAELSRSPVTSAGVALQLSDAAGIGYQIPAGPVPADGRPHLLTVTIATSDHAAYPLRLTGFTFSYLMPITSQGRATLRVGPVRAASTPGGPFGSPLPVLPAGRRPIATAAAQSRIGVSRQPQLLSTRSGPGGAVTVSLDSGFGNDGSGTGVPAGLAVTAGPQPPMLTGLAVGSFLADTGQRVGATVAASLDGTTVPVRLVGSAGQFPTLGTSSGIVVDQAALQNELRAVGAAPEPVTEWWLATPRAPHVTGLPAGSAIDLRATTASALSAEPLSAAPQQALLAVALAGAILALAGFLVSAATARERVRDVALLDALGAPPSRITGLLCLEQAMLALPAAVAGVLLGVLLSRLIIPAVTLTLQAAHPVPPVQVELPWGPMIASAAVIAAIPTLAAALSAGRRGGTGQLRTEVEP